MKLAVRMKRISLNIKIIMVSIAIWIPFMVAYMGYESYEEDKYIIDEASRISETSNRTIIATLNTLTRDGRLPEGTRLLDNLRNEIDGLKSVSIISTSRLDKILQPFYPLPGATHTDAKSGGQIKSNEENGSGPARLGNPARDKWQHQVLETGRTIIVTEQDGIRTLMPFMISNSECTAVTPDCYLSTRNGTVAGALDMIFSTEKLSTIGLHNIFLVVIALLLAGLIMITVLSVVVHYIIIRKIHLVRNALHQLATGNLSIRLPRISKDELGDVAHDFNAMASIIEHDKNNLEEIVALRTQELMTSNERLRVSRDEAVSASRTKTEFLSTMSHEIRTPLNGVIGMLSLLRTMDTDPEHMDYIETAYNSGHILMTILNDILDISKIEANKILLEQVNFDIGHTVTDIINLLSEDATRKSLRLTYSLPDEYPAPIKGDPTRLRQILVNLISNSIKFTETGYVDLSIRAVKEHKYFVLFEFKVTDTGIGISKENQDKVFKKFAQSDSSITRKYGGTGLGLAIVKKLINKMGGNIHLRSEFGKGSEFTFSLPFNRPTEDIIKTIVNNAQAIRIIIISDFEDDARKIQKQLNSCGWMVDIAASDDDAISRMIAAQETPEPYHIAIIEKKYGQNMPITLATKIRNTLELKSIKIIAINEVGERGDGQRARLGGISGYLVKPVPLSILTRCIIDVLSLPENPTPQLITRHSIIEKEKLDDKRSDAEKEEQKKSILLVEDNPVNQKIGMAMLNKLGHDVVVVENGEQAVVAAGNNQFHMILMDCQMPVMDGYEATRKIRQNEKLTNSHVPIVAMTANAYPEDIEKCLQSGMDSHLTKPVDITTLDRAMRSYFKPSNDAGGATA